ncbi:MAG: glycosyltransferase [Elusimicrobiota bacterium]
MAEQMRYEPLISVITPAKKLEYCGRVIESVKKVNYPAEKIEQIIVEGNQPSKQRNEGAKTASGEILFFFDNDCEISPQLFSEVLKHFENPQTTAVAGVSIVKRDAPPMVRASNYVFSSLFGGFTIRFKHQQAGEARPATDKHFIMCNVAIRKDIFLKEGGLNEEIYPGEEDQFFKLLYKKGYSLIYEPQSVVYRQSRSTLKEFIKSIFIYGRAKIDQGFKNFSPVDILFFVPALFVVYLLFVFYLLLRDMACQSKAISSTLLPFYLSTSLPFYIIPLLLYVLIDLSVSILVTLRKKDTAALRLIYLFPLMHISGGLGEIWGLIKAIFGIKITKEKYTKVIKMKNFNE